MLWTVTISLSVSLVIVSLWANIKHWRACKKQLTEWRALCGHLNGQELLERGRFTEAQWRDLKRVCARPLEVHEAGEEEAGVVRARWVRLGEGVPPLLCVTHLPAPSGLLPPLSAWGVVVPGVSTMLGIIGTFYGIQSGLMEADLGRFMGGQAPSEAQVLGLVGGAGELFGAMSVAFVTSLGGMAAALLSTLFLAAARSYRGSVCDQIGALQERHFSEQGEGDEVARSVWRLARAVEALREEQRRGAAGVERRLDELTRQQLLRGSELQERIESLRHDRLLDRGAQQELLAEMMVQIDDLMELHLGEGEGRS